MATWSTAEVNNFPDSSFAFIAPGGTKDSDGKTTPRDLRKLPYKDGSGAVDLAHVRNALARLDQTDGISADKKASIKTMLEKELGKEQASLFRVTPIQLDSSGHLPSRIMLMQSGSWPNSVKGDFSISPEDLAQIKQNFDAGIGFPTDDASTGLAIDFKHDYADEAAGWIKGLQLEQFTDDKGNAQARLYADPVEWTDTGAQAVQNGRFKCISPSGYFGKKGTRMSAWANPTDLKQTVKNVLDGAGLTNIPFLRGMSPVRASATEDNIEELEYDKIVFMNKSQNNEGESMKIDEVRVKEREALSIPELDFLVEHKEELSAQEVAKFKLAADEKVEGKETLSAEDKAILDAVKSGDKKLVGANEEAIEKSTLDGLVATANQYRTEKADEIVELHIKRGAVKTEQKEFWTKQLLASEGEARESLETALAALPANEELSKEIGSGEGAVAGATAREQLHNLANQKIEAAAKEGKELLYTTALKEVSRENADLMKQDLAEQGVN